MDSADFVEAGPRRRGPRASAEASPGEGGAASQRGGAPARGGPPEGRWRGRGGSTGGALAASRPAAAAPVTPPPATPPPPAEYWTALGAVEALWRAAFEAALEADERLLHRAFRLWATSEQRADEGRVGGRRGRREKEEFMASGVLTSVEQFFGAFHWLPGADDFDDLLVEAKLFLFSAEVLSPDWDDPVNLAGGRWTAVIGIDAHNRPDRPPFPVWEELCLGLIGGASAVCREAVTGVVLVRKTPYVRLAVWVRDAADLAAVHAVGAWLRGVFPPELEILFQAHRNKDPRAYLHRLPPLVAASP